MPDKADESNTNELPENETNDSAGELEQASAIRGDLVENPALEVEDGAKDSSESESGDKGEGAGGDDTTGEESETEEGASGPEETETAAELTTEEDDAGVYEQPKTQDPGDFQPKGDYSFEITTTDGKTIKINSQAEAETFAEILDENPDLISASQFTKFNRSIARMDVGLERERQDYEDNKAKFEQEQAQAEVRDNQIRQWNGELNYLRSKGLIPTPTKEQDADWLNNKDADGIKEALSIFEWMDKENQARRQAGIAEVVSAVDAFQMMKAEQSEQIAQEERQREGEQRRSKGKMIGDNAPHQSVNQPAGSIIGEGGSLRDLVNEYQLNNM